MEIRKISKQLIIFAMKMKKYYKIHACASKSDKATFTEQQFRTAMKLKKLNKCTLKELGKSLNVSASSLCIMLNKMNEYGYVEREVDSKDRRNMFYFLTNKGEKFLSDEINRRLDLMDIRINKLSQDKKESLYKCLKELEGILEEIFQK